VGGDDRRHARILRITDEPISAPQSDGDISSAVEEGVAAAVKDLRAAGPAE
jgi:hypothetical protein